MSATTEKLTGFLNATGIVDTLVNNAGGSVGNTNTAIQSAAAATAFLPPTLPSYLTQVGLGSVAFGSAIQTGSAALSQGQYREALGDGVSAIGDVFGVLGGVANALNLKTLGTFATVGGNAITFLGIAIDNPNTIPNIQTAFGELGTEIQEVANGDSSYFQSTFANVGNNASTYLTSTMNSLSSSTNALAAAVIDYSTSSSSSALNTLLNTISSIETPLTNLYNSTGESALSTNIAVNADNSFSLTNGTGGNIENGQISVDSNGNVTGLTTNQNSSGVGLGTPPSNGDLPFITNNFDGTSQITDYGSSGNVTTTTYSGINGTGPIVSKTAIEPSGNTFVAGAPAESSIAWTGAITSTYSIPSSDWTAIDGNMATTIATYSGSANFVNPVLTALNAPNEYSTLAIGGASYTTITSANGLIGADSIAYSFPSPLPAGTNFLLWAPGGNFATTQFGQITSSEEGPYTFTVSASLGGAPVSALISVQTPSGNAPAWHYSVSGETITVTAPVNAPGYAPPDAVIVITPNAPVDTLAVAATTISNDVWGLAVPDQIPCFCRGTRLLTAGGEVPVEELVVGDRVKTLSGAFKPIRWIGFGRSLVTRANKLARPIVVRRGALADNLPHRDLYLTHGHALCFADGELTKALIPVEHLVNHVTIAWDDTARVVEYYHIELDDHDVVFAEGAAAETYYEARNRAYFQNTRDGSEAGAEKSTYAPVLHDGDFVARVWADLRARAGAEIAADTTDEPDLHLSVDGVRLEAAAVEDGLYTFKLDRPPVGPLLLRSRSAVPSLLGESRHEHRRLGVPLRQVFVQGRGTMLVFDHDAPLLRDGGCHTPENGFCWTDGELALPPEMFANLRGGFSLLVRTERRDINYPLGATAAVA